MVHSCMVYTECAETAAVSCGTSHASAQAHHFSGFSKMHYKKLVTHAESHARKVSLLKSREQRYNILKAININNTCTSLQQIKFIPQ